ncbi:MAG: threonine synthase [Caldisericaceae bacterium]|nr:threonine synthase [Caldisericaceae bacterium]
MGNHYLYQCSHCQQTFSAGEIEGNFIYLCPNCGKTEKNAPLKGVLQVVYDYASFALKTGRDEFLKLPAGQPFLFPDLWPLDYDQQSGDLKGLSRTLVQNLTLPENQLLNFEFQGQSFKVLDETRNPTFSFKDRASILVVLKALQLGIGEIGAASTGNAGSSLAGICARAGLQARIWVPEAIPQAKLLQIAAYGAKVHKVAGDYDLAFDQSIEICQQNGWYNRNTAFNPLTIEGKKSAAFDIFLQTQGQLPDLIFVPVGDGVIIAGLYKGFNELFELGWIDRLPRLIAVQSTGSDALVRFLNEGVFKFKPAQTIADSISAGAPRNLFLAVQAVEKTQGLALAVTDQQILKAQAILAQKFGLLAEPAAAASFAGFLKMTEQGALSPVQQSLILITGNGLKDVRALELSIKQIQEQNLDS